ncbi:PH domain-containing protein [Paenibacillus caseinilyticus]|uniref:PH domain-containing protein n=1 Tax=Paenibacillus caseinilyticus TaxID=3098138 RepID=UPI0022B93E85|nr:PH domain-containing protein [Paenibacillus caseinilyticus]MCZ8518907.1 PH domain-containing protein [Paenibacillus caseinilyticus]
MPTIDEIKSQIMQLENGAKMVKESEVKELPGLLHENERIQGIAKGRYNKMNGLAIATDKRVLFVAKALFLLKHEELPYSKITSVQFEPMGPMLRLASLSFMGIGNTIVFDNADKAEATKLAEIVRSRTA